MHRAYHAADASLRVFAGQDDGTDANLLGQFATYAYKLDSTRLSIVRPNGVHTDYTYETPVTGRIKNINHYLPGTPAKTISSRTYGYDTLDRMRWFQKSASTQTNPLENGKGESYDYDGAGQLTSAAYEVVNPSGVNAPNDSFGYDNAGSRTTVNGLAYTLNTAGLNQYATAGSYGAATYDTRGNLKTLGSFSASYNAQNEMTSGSASGAVTFSYDALGRCVKRTINGAASYFYYDGWSLIEEDNSAGAAQLLYVYGPATDELAAMWNASSTSWSWYHYDARGSVTHLTNASGQVVEQYSYSAFGIPSYYNGSGSQLGASAFNNRFLFQGRDWIKELSLYDYRNRMYHPGTGRFLQPDPLSLDAGDPNIYRYCNNDPISGNDPMGLGDPISIGTLTYGGFGYGIDPSSPSNDSSSSFGSPLSSVPAESSWSFSFGGFGSFGSSIVNYGLPSSLAQLSRGFGSSGSGTSVNANAATPIDYTQGSRKLGSISNPIHLHDTDLFPILNNVHAAVKADHLISMSYKQWTAYMRTLNISEFYNTNYYVYEGVLQSLNGVVSQGHEANYIGVGMGYAARGWSIAAMEWSPTGLYAWKDSQFAWYGLTGQWNRLRYSAMRGSEENWALLGYIYYLNGGHL